MRVRPAVEALEDRSLMARVVVVLDFAPRQSPVEEQRITGRVRFLLDRFDDVKVIRGPGPAWHDRGLRDPDLLVLVARIAGRGLVRQAGVAPQAPVGSSVEGTAFVFAASIRAAFPFPFQYTSAVAAVVVHEVSHMIGLGHPVSPLPLDLMGQNVGRTPWDKRLLGTRVRAELFDRNFDPFVGWQDAAREWRRAARLPSEPGLDPGVTPLRADGLPAGSADLGLPPEPVPELDPAAVDQCFLDMG